MSAAFLAVYSSYFWWDTLRAYHPVDAIWCIAYFYRMPAPWRLLASLLMPWGGFYRPMSGLFYLSIFSVFGLNPVPYHVATWLLLLASAWLMYRFARLLGCGELAAGLAGLIACYHAGLSNLYYDTAFIPDVLCYFFYLSSFVYYARIRERGRLRTGEMLAFLGLYLCALNSKEMAVTLPVLLLVYEWIYHGPERPEMKAILAWLRGPGRVALFASVLSGLYAYGLAYGHDRMMSAPAYHPVLSLERVKWFQEAYFEDMLLGWKPGWGGILAFWVMLALLAWFRRRPVFRFCWIFMVLTPLPILFLEGRRGACLAIPMAGWTIFGSAIFVDLANALSGPISRQGPLGRRGPQAVVAVIVATAVIAWASENRERERVFADPIMVALGRQTWEVIGQFQTVNPQVRPGSHVAFLDDPFKTWDMLFLAELWFRDRSLDIHVARGGPLSPGELAKMDYVFTFDGGRLVRLK